MQDNELHEEKMKQWERLGILFDAISHPYRLFLLENIGTQTIKELAKVPGISPAALQRHINKLSSTHLIEKKDNVYRLTPIGREVQKQLQTFDSLVSELIELEKDTVRSKVFESPLSIKDVEKILTEMKRKEKK